MFLIRRVSWRGSGGDALIALPFKRTVMGLEAAVPRGGEVGGRGLKKTRHVVELQRETIWNRRLDCFHSSGSKNGKRRELHPPLDLKLNPGSAPSLPFMSETTCTLALLPLLNYSRGCEKTC